MGNGRTETHRVSTFVPEIAPPAGLTFNRFLAAAPHARVAHNTALRALAGLRPHTLALMHGSSFRGDGAAALNGLADALEQRCGPESAFVGVPGVLANPHP